jgi:hypothetical protein
LLEIARIRLKESGVSNCEFKAGDAYQLASLADRPRLARAVGGSVEAEGLQGAVSTNKLIALTKETRHPFMRRALKAAREIRAQRTATVLHNDI